jgi:hypothetical protein
MDAGSQSYCTISVNIFIYQKVGEEDQLGAFYLARGSQALVGTETVMPASQSRLTATEDAEIENHLFYLPNGTVARGRHILILPAIKWRWGWFTAFKGEGRGIDWGLI